MEVVKDNDVRTHASFFREQKPAAFGWIGTGSDGVCQRASPHCDGEGGIALKAERRRG